MHNPTLDNRDWAKETRKNTLLYPDDDVVRFVSHHRNGLENRTPSAIDIGCGSGRHMKLLIEKGYHTQGLDSGQEAVAVANETFGNIAEYSGAFCADFRTHQFDRKFDLILAWGVLFLVPPSEMPGNLKILLNMLTEEGAIIFNVRTPDNWFYGLGEEVENNSLLLDDRAGPYASLQYSFLTEDDLRALVSEAGGRIEKIEKVTQTKENLTQLHAWLQVEVRAGTGK